MPYKDPSVGRARRALRAATPEVRAANRASHKRRYDADPAAYRAKQRAYRRKWRTAHPEEAKARARRWYLANKEYMLARGRKYRGIPTPTRPKPVFCEAQCGRKAFLIDHCHSTGAFRGWLCNKCNMAIGALGDNTEGVRKALNYLLGV